MAIAEGEAELEWKNPLMDVPSSAMGERILNTGDEVSFHINEKNAVKIADERQYNFKLETKPRHYPIFWMVSLLWFGL